MKPCVTFQWIDPCPSERLQVAQRKLLESVEALGLEPALFHAGPEMIKLGDILQHASEQFRRQLCLVQFRCHFDAEPLHDCQSHQGSRLSPQGTTLGRSVRRG